MFIENVQRYDDDDDDDQRMNEYIRGRPRLAFALQTSMIYCEYDDDDDETGVVCNGIMFIPNFLKGGTYRHHSNLIIRIRQSTSLTFDVMV